LTVTLAQAHNFGRILLNRQFFPSLGSRLTIKMVSTIG